MDLNANKPKTLIGIHEKMDIPSLGMFEIPCKIDTGADTSSIHCDRIHLVEKDGIEHIAFILLDKNWPQYTGEWVHISEFREKKIKSSFGDFEFRYQVRLPITVLGRKIRARFTLTNRESMKYPVLLGKNLLRNRFLVDVSKTQ